MSISEEHHQGRRESFPETTPAGQPSRRVFCSVVCKAASVAAAGAVFGGCGKGPTSPGGDAPQLSTVAAAVTGRTVTVTVAGGPLATTGGAALVSSSLGNFLVFRGSDAAATVVTARCTHEACVVSGFESSQYVCPCHGSRFTTTGSVVSGPAGSPLTVFPSTFANGVVTFTA